MLYKFDSYIFLRLTEAKQVSITLKIIFSFNVLKSHRDCESSENKEARPGTEVQDGVPTHNRTQNDRQIRIKVKRRHHQAHTRVAKMGVFKNNDIKL